MDKRRTSCSHDNAVSSDCSQQCDNSHRIIKNQNNHNSGLIQDDELIKSTSRIGFRKRRTTIPYNHHRSQLLSSPTLLILIRLMILLFFSLIVYYTFLYIYPKPKQSGWEQVWYNTIDWLMGE